MKAFGQYVLALIAGVALVGGVAWLLANEAGRKTILVSGMLAVVTQMAAFGIARALRDKRVLLGWGLGIFLRFFALVLYAVFVARLGRALVPPALLSFAAMLFVTTVVEPIFLKR